MRQKQHSRHWSRILYRDPWFLHISNGKQDRLSRTLLFHRVFTKIFEKASYVPLYTSFPLCICNRVLIKVKGYNMVRTVNELAMLNGKNFFLSSICHSMTRMNWASFSILSRMIFLSGGENFQIIFYCVRFIFISTGISYLRQWRPADGK